FGSLEQTSKPLVKVSVIVFWYEPSTHQGCKLVPCSVWSTTIPSPASHNLIIPINSITSKFSSSKPNFLKLRKVLTIKNQFNLPFPFKESIWIVLTIKGWDFKFQTSQTIINSFISSKRIGITLFTVLWTSPWSVDGTIIKEFFFIIGLDGSPWSISSCSWSRTGWLANLHIIKPLMDLFQACVDKISKSIIQSTHLQVR